MLSKGIAFPPCLARRESISFYFFLAEYLPMNIHYFLTKDLYILLVPFGCYLNSEPYV